MHKKYAKDGLAVISVSLDDLEGTAKEKMEVLEKVRGFLHAQGADFTNFLLEEPVDLDKKFHFFAPPCYFVFDRRGRWYQFRGDEDGPVNYAAMEKLVIALLRERN